VFSWIFFAAKGGSGRLKRTRAGAVSWLGRPMRDGARLLPKNPCWSGRGKSRAKSLEDWRAKVTFSVSYQLANETE
jgi:hypothetical protein